MLFFCFLYDGSEISKVKSRASVMLYNNDKKTWEPAEGIRGMSYVQVYHHEGNNTFRIVGRSMTDHQVVSGYFCISTCRVPGVDA